MKFKTYISKEGRHRSTVSCINWCNTDEVYTCSDDHCLYKWSIINRDSVQVARLPDDFFPTDLHWLTLMSTGRSSKAGDSLLITSNSGRFIILNKGARVERNITAHAGAITSGRWSPDGAGLLTAGEDGVIKIWSRSGMLRSTVVQNEGPIRCARWSALSNSIVYCQGSFMSIKPLAANSKVIKWRAHDGLVLSLCWSNDPYLIASGGEDRRYKIWDKQGNNLYASSLDDYAITSIEFSPDGQNLAIGGFNMLRLCNFTGWTHSITRFSKPSTGSLFGINWSPDGTQIAVGTNSGEIVFGHIIERQLVNKNLKVTTTGRKTLMFEDIVTRSKDTIDFPDRIINVKLGYGHLVVTTPFQVHIFNENYINTPIIIDGRPDVQIIILGKKNFVLVDNSSIFVYTYTGRLHLNPRFVGSQTQIINLTNKNISLGLDVLAVRDYVDQTIIHLFDLMPGVSRQEEPFTIHSKTQIIEISVCRAGDVEDQYLVFIDANHDLYLTSCRSGPEFPLYKIGTQVMSVLWSSEANILAGIHDSCYTIWYCPGEACNDPTLIALTTVTHDTTEYGKNLMFENFEGNMITFRSAGAIIPVSIKIYCDVLHKCLIQGMWQQALKICRLAQNQILWATLAAIASKKNQIQISEEAYSCALQIDKVEYLQYIKELPQSSPEQFAENSILNGRITEAETVLLHNKNFTEAIQLCVRMHHWDRALEIAEKNQTDIDYVLEERKKYLNAINRSNEMNQKFVNFIDKKNNKH